MYTCIILSEGKRERERRRDLHTHTEMLPGGGAGRLLGRERGAHAPWAGHENAV